MILDPWSPFGIVEESNLTRFHETTWRVLSEEDGVRDQKKYNDDRTCVNSSPSQSLLHVRDRVVSRTPALSLFELGSPVRRPNLGVRTFQKPPLRKRSIGWEQRT